MDDLHSRGKAMENMFFENRDQELLNKLRAELEGDQKLQVLQAASGISDESVLNALSDQGVTAESMSALSLIPLVTVAWSDGSLDAKEKEAILKAAEASGITAGSASASLLESWLASKPQASLLDTWKAYIGTLKTSVDDTAFGQVKASILNRAQNVAQAAGGFLGIGSVSDSEQKAIADLESAFE